MKGTVKIAVLGWSSLLWDLRPEFDDHHKPWESDRPDIKIEFSRVSQTWRGALTLVVDPVDVVTCRVAYALSGRGNIDPAINDLRVREGTG